MEHSVTYATKLWEEGWQDTLKRHSGADLVIGNNLKPETKKKLKYILKSKFYDIGKTDDPYYKPELEAVKRVKTKYILWYSGDVYPPEGNWVDKAKKLLKTYPIVSPFWEDNYDDYVRMALAQKRGDMTIEKFGFADWFFSDQAYFAETKVMQNIDYEADNDIKQYYPDHGGNSFERRVAQWLANNNKQRAVLKDYKYTHIARENK